MRLYHQVDRVLLGREGVLLLDWEPVVDLVAEGVLWSALVVMDG